MAKRDRHKAQKEVVLNVYTNAPSKFKYDLLEMFYKGAYGGTIGLMEAFNTETNKEELILVGIAYENEKQVTYPLASILKPEDVKKYLAPNGTGGFDKDEPSNG